MRQQTKLAGDKIIQQSSIIRCYDVLVVRRVKLQQDMPVLMLPGIFLFKLELNIFWILLSYHVLHALNRLTLWLT